MNLRHTIRCEDDKAILDLHAALFPYILHGSLDGFMLVDQHVDYLACLMTPYAFSVTQLPFRVDTANRFVNQMRHELSSMNTLWSDYPAIRLDDVNNIMNLKPPTTDLNARLRQASIGARQLFFGTLRDGPGQGHWAALPYGIDEGRTAVELTDLGIGDLTDDPALILRTYRNQELLTALVGHATKQGWRKDYIIKYMMAKAPQVVANLTEGKSVVILRPEVKADGSALTEWIDRTKILLSLALGFAGE